MARDADMQPNNNQFACAVYIAENLKSTAKEKKIMLTMPPGEGKSRITVALLYLMLKKSFTRFTLLFSHEAIMKADQISLQRLQKHWGLDIRYKVYEKDEEIPARQNDVLIMDEADYLILDKSYMPDKKFKFIVGLTATSLSNKDGAEEMLLKNQNYRICDSKVQASFDPRDSLELCTADEFLRMSSQAAKLVYTRDVTQVESLKEMGLQNKLQVRVDISDMTALRSLKKSDMLIVTKPILLRGFDYKSDAPEGINLLMMSSVSSARALLQALGRVGRYQQPGKRFQWKDLLQQIDQKENDEIIGAILKVDATKTKASKQKKVTAETTRIGARTRSATTLQDATILFGTRKRTEKAQKKQDKRAKASTKLLK